jgi:hypothetical protein
MPTAEFAKKLMEGKVKPRAKRIDEMSEMEKKVHFARTKREQTANSFGEE